MFKRQKMSHKASKRNFTRNALRVHKKNAPVGLGVRGGTRL